MTESVVSPAPTKRPSRVRPAATDAGIVLGWFALLGLLGGVVWERVTPLAAFTRTADNGTMGEEELARQFATNGWFFVIAAAGGVLSGVVLLLWRHRSPLRMVLLVGIGGALGTLVMQQVGLHLGPGDPNVLLPKVPVGTRVPLRLEPDAHGVYFVWSVAALLGAVIALWGTEQRATARTREEIARFEVPRSG